MPKCHKIYPNCTWQVPSEWHGLNFDTALLTKVYWNYATHIVRVCVTHKTPINPDLPFTNKSNLQVHFGSKAMASLYDLLCYHSLTSTDPLLEELIAYLLHAFILTFSIILLTNTPRMRSQSIQSTLRYPHFILTTQLTFLKLFYIVLIFYATPKSLPQGRWHRTYKRVAGRERPTTRRRARGPRPPRSHPPRRGPPAETAFPGLSRRETAGATASC